jgi:Concanavalin A-like lectin/glucanases superfamily
MTSVQPVSPFATALRYATAPYARGVATQALTLGSAAAGVSAIAGYDFATFQSRYGLQSADLVASYVLTLKADQLDAPAVVEIGWAGSSGAGTSRIVVPAGSLAGESFGVPGLPSDPNLVLRSLSEQPPPTGLAPSGPGKWDLTVLLGNGARLLWTLTGEAQTLAAAARDVRAQRRIETARGGSLDRIGAGIGVSRLLAAAYRLDYDPATIALYHLDDAVMPVVDTTHDYPGASVGAQRGIAGKFGQAAQITAAGGIVIADAVAFAIDPAVGFTVEMFANLAAAPGATEVVLFAQKRPRFDQSDSPGWALALEPLVAGHVLAFTLTDSAGVVVRAAAAAAPAAGSWFHVAGVVDPAAGQAHVLLNGAVIASELLGTLGRVDTGADIGLGCDPLGASHLNGAIDEVRFSNIARSDFATVLGASPQPYSVDPQVIALYHLDEIDDWIDEERGVHFAQNRGATRAAKARFAGGLQFPGDALPPAHCASERDFQLKLSSGAWDHSAGGAPVAAGPYARFGYRQGAIQEPGFDGAPHAVLVNDQVPGAARGRITTACYGFAPPDAANVASPTQTINAFQAAGRTAQEAIDYYGEWFGRDKSFFSSAYAANGITATYEPCLPTNGGPTAVLIPASPEFVFGAQDSFTVEAFIKADPVSASYGRAVIASRSQGLRIGEPPGAETGWALTLGPYRSIPDNLRWTVGDAGGTLVTVDANISLADGTFHHVAGVVDRDLGAALLYVNGVEAGQTPLGSLAAAGSAAPITIGNVPALTAPYAGLIDEVRISCIARRSFAPVLGESDARYRQRLAIFKPWRLPNVPTIRGAVQALTLSDPTQADVTGLLLGPSDPPDSLVQFDIDDTDSTRFCASRWLRAIPDRLTPGQSIAADGTLSGLEPAVAGKPLAATSPALVQEANGANFTFAATASRGVCLSAARMLERLAARLATVSPASSMTVLSAYIAPPLTPGVTLPATNDSLGRALTLTLAAAGPRFDLGMLGALAFESGAPYVRYQTPSGGTPNLRLVAAAGDDLDLVATSFGGGSNPGRDLSSRQIVTLSQATTITIARPTLPLTGAGAAQVDWSLLPLGPAGGTLAPGSPGAVVLTATGMGLVTLTARCTLVDGVTVLTGSIDLIIASQSLEGCDSLGADGTPNASEVSQSGGPDTDFRINYLTAGGDMAVDYASPAAGRMQLSLANALHNLATLAAREPGAPRIKVLAAYDPTQSNLQSVGRGVVVAPSGTGLTAGRLAALAFIAGFSYIERRRYPPSVYLSVPAGERFSIVAGSLRRLWPGGRISGRGAYMAGEFDAAGPRDNPFNPATLQPFTDARVTFEPGVSNLVQPVLAAALTALLNAIAGDGIAGTLEVVAGFLGTDPALLGVGRAVVARHSVVTPDRLAGYALQVGFGFVDHRAATAGGAAIYMATYPAAGLPPSLLNNADPNAPYYEVGRNALVQLSVRPQLPIPGRLDWSAQAVCPAAAGLSTALPDPSDAPGMTQQVFQATAAGAVAAVATFSLNDFSDPYQFTVTPRASQNGSAPKLSKDQYDDLLNFLDVCHPVGVAGLTRQLRGFVHGFRRPARWDRLPTSQTYPRYRGET